MLTQKIYFFIIFTLLTFFTVSCGNSTVAPLIGNNVSYPGSIVAFDSNHFLMLNTSANGDYRDGSIQYYSVDTSGNHSLQNAFSVPAHGSEIAINRDKNLVALSFDSSVSPTQIQFYDYRDPTNPQLLPNLSLSFYEAGGKQSIKRLSFFTPSGSLPAGGNNFYYLYGMIYSFQQDDGSNSNIPTRVFVAKVAKDFSQANVMFTLSYNIGDQNSLAQKSNSISLYSYSFGSSSPSYDEAHNLFIAFPTGSIGGIDSVTNPPLPPSIYDYFNKTTPQSNTVTCVTISNCPQPDLRANSLFAVDFVAILNGEPLNNSTYFVPLAWNGNGIPYGATTNGVVINYASYVAAGGSATTGSSNGDLNSFSFQSNFWASQWMNTPDLGSGGNQCYAAGATTTANQYSLNLVGNNALLVSKTGINGAGDSNGNGNEVFQITGLDILRNSIDVVKSVRGTVNSHGESDFNLIAPVQILDPYNTYYSNIQAQTGATWLNSVSPIIPYMYSRTTSVSGFDSTTSAVVDYGVLNFGSNSCLPYWTRDTVSGFGSLGADTAWLGSSPNPIAQGSNAGFANATTDPTNPFNYAFPYTDGAELCTDVAPVVNTPIVFCANFLSGEITHFTTAASGTIFNKY